MTDKELLEKILEESKNTNEQLKGLISDINFFIVSIVFMLVMIFVKLNI